MGGIVALPTNVGFAAGVNRGIERAQGDFVALVNNDMELHPDFLGELVAGARRRAPRRCAVTAKMLGYHDRGVIDGAGDVLRWSGVVMPRGRGERDHGQYDEPAEVFSACGGRGPLPACRASRSRACSTRPSSPRWRTSTGASARGCSATAAATSRARSPTTWARRRCAARGARDPWFWGLPVRNCIWMWVKNYPRDCLLRNAHLLLAHELAGLYFAAREGMARAQLRAWRDALRGLPRVLRQRREIQSRRSIGRRELEQVIQAEPVGWRRAWTLLRSGAGARRRSGPTPPACASWPGREDAACPRTTGSVTVLGEPPRLDTI